MNIKLLESRHIAVLQFSFQVLCLPEGFSLKHGAPFQGSALTSARHGTAASRHLSGPSGGLDEHMARLPSSQ